MNATIVHNIALKLHTISTRKTRWVQQLILIRNNMKGNYVALVIAFRRCFMAASAYFRGVWKRKLPEPAPLKNFHSAHCVLFRARWHKTLARKVHDPKITHLSCDEEKKNCPICFPGCFSLYTFQHWPRSIYKSFFSVTNDLYNFSNSDNNTTLNIT